jgi:hypothetical protein
VAEAEGLQVVAMSETVEEHLDNASQQHHNHTGVEEVRRIVGYHQVHGPTLLSTSTVTTTHQ